MPYALNYNDRICRNDWRIVFGIFGRHVYGTCLTSSGGKEENAIQMLTPLATLTGFRGDVRHFHGRQSYRHSHTVPKRIPIAVLPELRRRARQLPRAANTNH